MIKRTLHPSVLSSADIRVDASTSFASCTYDRQMFNSRAPPYTPPRGHGKRAGSATVEFTLFKTLPIESCLTVRLSMVVRLTISCEHFDGIEDLSRSRQGELLEHSCSRPFSHSQRDRHTIHLNRTAPSEPGKLQIDRYFGSHRFLLGADDVHGVAVLPHLFY